MVTSNIPVILNDLDQELHEYRASEITKDVPVFHGKVAACLCKILWLNRLTCNKARRQLIIVCLKHSRSQGQDHVASMRTGTHDISAVFVAYLSNESDFRW